MFSLSLRLTVFTSLITSVLLGMAQVIGRAAPAGQIVPIVTYDSPTILLVDVNRHLVGSRRSNPEVIYDAVVSPNQQKIAFGMSDGTKTHIYAADLYSDESRRLTSDDMGGESPAWSPDSKQIAFVGLEPANKRGIYVVPVNGESPPQTILKAGTFASPSWSGDGLQLTFAASRYRDLPDLFVVDSACRLRCDRELLQITNTLVVDTIPVWSPDGTKIAFLSNRSGNYEIYVLDTACMQPTTRKCTLEIPRHLQFKPLIVPFLMMWSQDGSELYFRGRDLRKNEPGLYAAKADCFKNPDGCDIRLIYNLADRLQRKRG